MSFLDAYNTQEEPLAALTPPSKRGFFIGVVSSIVIIGGLIMGGVWMVTSGRTLIAHGHAAFTSVTASVHALKEKQFVSARANAVSAVAEWSAVDSQLRAFAWIAKAPLVGGYMRGALDIGEAGVLVSRALVRAVDITERLRTPLGPLAESIDFRKVPEAQRRVFFATLTTMDADIRATMQEFRSGVDFFLHARSALPSFVLPERIETALESLSTFDPLFARVEDLVLLLPKFAGYPEPASTLFLFQNNDELRPTGGFVGTYGLLRANAGVIESLRTDDVYRLDKGTPKDTVLPKPPTPIRKFLGVKQWYFRDANWSPDFPTSAATLLDLYHREDPRAAVPPSIIAITPVVLEQLLQLTGPMTIDGIPFTALNVTDTLEYEVEQGFAKRGIAMEDRKKIVGALTDAVVAALLRMPSETIPEFFATMTRLLNEKHIVVYHTDPAVQTQIVQRGWGAAFPRPSEHNFLAVIDANLGSLKTDQVIDRSIEYSVDYTQLRPRARAVVTYRHRGQFTWKTTRYQTYTRIFVPSGSTLVEAEGLLAKPRSLKPGKVDVTSDLGYTVFGGFIAIEPGKQGTLTFVFDLPERYRLFAAPRAHFTVYKQAGTTATPLTLQLQFDMTVKAAMPAEAREEQGDRVYRVTTDLRTDREFSISF